MSQFVAAYPESSWNIQGPLATIETEDSAPTLFFHNTDDYYKDSNHDPKGLYATQAALMKAKLDAVGTPTATLTDYSSGHAVPQTAAALQNMYDFLVSHIISPISDAVVPGITGSAPASAPATFNLMGMKVGPDYKGIVIRNGRKLMVR
jgi:hypothetical protein